MRKHRYKAVPAVHPANSASLTPIARRVLRLTTRAWLPAALLRPRSSELPPDERVRLSGDW
jgi:hypothetical protein